MPWCATSVDINGTFIENQWGVCDDNCPGVRKGRFSNSKFLNLISCTNYCISHNVINLFESRYQKF